MRKGFKSSRGAMRGTMGGAPICLVGAVGFATVAIGSGPFLKSVRLEQYSKLWLNNNYRWFTPYHAFAANLCEEFRYVSRQASEQKCNNSPFSRKGIARSSAM